MAGHLAMVSCEQPPICESQSLFCETESWQVQFSRYVSVPEGISSDCPLLIRQSARRRTTKLGIWISSNLPTASLQIYTDRPRFGPASTYILSVTLQDTVLEEHYVSRLNFSWPQVSCVAGFPSRGTRAVLVSYKDSVDEIHKFALRFPTVSEVESFIRFLEHIFKGASELEHFPRRLEREKSMISTITCNSGGSPSKNYFQESSPQSSQLPSSSDNTIEQLSCNNETVPMISDERIPPTYPPSFMSLLASCHTHAVQETSAVPVLDEDLKSQIARYMDDSSFQDLLLRVEEVMTAIENERPYLSAT